MSYHNQVCAQLCLWSDWQLGRWNGKDHPCYQTEQETNLDCRKEGKHNLILNCNWSIKPHFQCHLDYISNPAISSEDNILSNKLKDDQYDLSGELKIVLPWWRFEHLISGTHQLARNIIFSFKQHQGRSNQW